MQNLLYTLTKTGTHIFTGRNSSGFYKRRREGPIFGPGSTSAGSLFDGGRCPTIQAEKSEMRYVSGNYIII